MDLCGPGLPQQPHDAGGGSTPDDGVVDDDYPLAPYYGGNGVELDTHLVLPVFLAGGDEGAGDVLVLDEAGAVGDAGLPGIADGGIDAGVGHADHDVGLDRMLQGQEGSCTEPSLVDAGTVDHRVRPGKVDKLKHTQAALGLAAVGPYAPQAGLVGDDDFAGFHIPEEVGADGVQSAALRGEHIAAVQSTDAQRPEAVGVPGGDQLAGERSTRE